MLKFLLHCTISAELGNVESLKEALTNIGTVDKHFTTIIEFWSNMAVLLNHLKRKISSGEVFLENIEDPKYAKRFETSIANAEKVYFIPTLKAKLSDSTKGI